MKDELKGIRFLLAHVKATVENNKISAQSGLDIAVPAPGQLHWPADRGNFPDWFYLVTEVREDVLEVIPGSFDSVMAGPEDIILPREVMGEYVFLSLAMAATLPKDAVGRGFACLDDDTYNRVIDSQIEYETGEKGEQPSFAFAALPYSHGNDSRKAYHRGMLKMLQAEQAKLLAGIFAAEEAEEDFLAEKVKALVASGRFVPVFGPRRSTLAAGAETKNPRVSCRMEGFDDIIVVEYEPAAKTLRIMCFTPEDEYSQAFDNWRIVDKDAVQLGTVVGHKAIIKDLAEFDGMICLVDESGECHVLNKLEE